MEWHPIDEGTNPDPDPDPLLPTPGSKWFLTPTSGDPFPSEVAATILEVKADWVRYSLGPVFNDNRKPLKDFLAIYRPIP